MNITKSAALIFCLTLSTGLQAATLVDTGVIKCLDTTCGGSVLDSNQSLAARFTLDQASSVNALSVWMNTDNLMHVGSTFTMVVYGGDIIIANEFNGMTFNATTPDINNELFSQTLTISAIGETDNFDNYWQSLTGINLELGVGSYWLSLESRGSDNYEGSVPVGEWGALNPLDTYAFYYTPNGSWLEDPAADFAFTVTGEITAVPLPPAAWLFISGLSWLVAVSRRKTGE